MPVSSLGTQTHPPEGAEGTTLLPGRAATAFACTAIAGTQTSSLIGHVTGSIVDLGLQVGDTSFVRTSDAATATDLTKMSHLGTLTNIGDDAEHDLSNLPNLPTVSHIGNLAGADKRRDFGGLVILRAGQTELTQTMETQTTESLFDSTFPELQDMETQTDDVATMSMVAEAAAAAAAAAE